MPIPTETFDAGLHHVKVAYLSDDGVLYRTTCREGWEDLVGAPSGVDPRTLPPLPKGTKVRRAHIFSIDTTVTPNVYKRRSYPLCTIAAVASYAFNGAPLSGVSRDGFTWNTLGWTGEKRRKLD
jgi:hypothetical protein